MVRRRDIVGIGTLLALLPSVPFEEPPVYRAPKVYACIRAFSLSTLGALLFTSAAVSQKPPCISGCNPYSVSVTPDNQADTVIASSNSLVALFTVDNTDTATDTYILTCSASHGSLLTCVSVVPSSVTLAHFHDTTVTVTYNVGTRGGTLTLTATGNASDNGSYILTALPVGKPGVALRNANGDTRDYSLCLTSSAGEASAWQCGDLLVGHSLPGYATLGRERSLSLLYNSAEAVPVQVVAAAVTEGVGVAPPDSVYAELDFGASLTPRASAKYASWTGTRQIALSFVDTTETSSGVYPYSLLVRNYYSGTHYDSTLTGNAIFVQRRSGSFGRGWYLGGWEHLWFNQPIGSPNGSILWASSVESARLYAKKDSLTWVAPLGGFQDTIIYSSSAHTYTRHLRHGITVTFDTTGYHVATTNRTGQTTNFYHPTHTIDSLTVPPAGQARTTYQFSYDGNGNLSQITMPDGRSMSVHNSSGLVTSIYDPDGDSTRFAYDAAGRMTSRTTRAGFTTHYYYGPTGLHVDSASVPLDTATNHLQTATAHFYPWDEKGLNGLAAVDTSVAYTKIDGPRTDVQDTAIFWVNKYGAPTKTIDPIGATTTIARADVNHPTLVTGATYPDGRVVHMGWNTRGNLDTLRDSAAGLPTALTRWYYDSVQAPDSPDSVIDPVGIVSRFAYDTMGLLLDATAPNGHVTHYYIRPGGTWKGVVDSVAERQVSYWDSSSHGTLVGDVTTRFALNTLGNDTSSTSPLGRVRRYQRDSTQRVTNVYDPAGHRTQLAYDALNRTTQVAVYDSASGALATNYYYGLIGLDSVADPRGVTRRYGHDAAGRGNTETDDYGNIERRYFNLAGLLDSLRPRQADSLSVMSRHRYDAVGRDTLTTWDSYDSLDAAGSLRRHYDVMGRIDSGTPSSGVRVTRTYFANGAVHSEHNVSTNTYAYDAAGRRNWYVIGTPGSLLYGDSVSYVYDGTSGDLRWIKARWRADGGGGSGGNRRDSVQLWSDTLGRRDSVIFSNGAREWFAYDKDGMLRVFCGTRSSSNFQDLFRFMQYHIGVTAEGLIQQTSNYDLGHTIAHCTAGTNDMVQYNTYDSRHELIRQVDGVSNWIDSLRYDISGNRTRALRVVYGATNDTVTAEIDSIYPGHNLLARSWDPRFYPDSGNWTQYSYYFTGARAVQTPYVHHSPTSSNGWRWYLYDGLQRPTGTVEYVCSGNFCQLVTTPQSCRYDGLGRTSRPCDGSAPQLGYDGNNVVRTAGDSLTGWTFVHGPGTDDPLMGHDSYPLSGQTAFWITDGAGRQVAVADSGGYDCSVQTHCGGYYVSGQAWFVGGTTAARSFGAQRDSSSTIFHVSFFRNRWYDQDTGRWTQEDPIGIAGGVNLYGYVGNNPVMALDPFGLSADTVKFASNAVERQAQACATASRTCRQQLGALQNDKSTWLVQSGNLPGHVTGLTNTHAFPNRVVSGTITIDPSHFNAASQDLGVPVNFNTTFGHELGHANGNIEIANTTGDLGPSNHCDEQCASAVENQVRADLALPSVVPN
jgi:RHS repeat-associated protein